MGRLKKCPDNIQAFIRKQTNWKEFVKTIQKLAFGGFEYVNGNNVKCIAQPDSEMLKLLLYVSYGRPGEMDKDQTDKYEAMAKLKDAMEELPQGDFIAGGDVFGRAAEHKKKRLEKEAKEREAKNMPDALDDSEKDKI